MGREVLRKLIRATPFCPKAQYQATWNGSAQICFGTTQPPSHQFGRFQLSMHKWGLSFISICECYALDQITSHSILECPIHRAPRGYHGLLVLDFETGCRLNDAAANICKRPPTRKKRTNIMPLNYFLILFLFKYN